MNGFVLFLLTGIIACFCTESRCFSCSSGVADIVYLNIQKFSLYQHRGILVRVASEKLPFTFTCDDFSVVSDGTQARVLPLLSMPNSCIIFATDDRSASIKYNHSISKELGHDVLYTSELLEIPLEDQTSKCFCSVLPRRRLIGSTLPSKGRVLGSADPYRGVAFYTDPPVNRRPIFSDLLQSSSPLANEPNLSIYYSLTNRAVHNHTSRLLPAATGPFPHPGEFAHGNPAGNYISRGFVVLAAAILLHEIVRVVYRVLHEPNLVFQREPRESGGRQSRDVLHSERWGGRHIASVPVHRNGRRSKRDADRSALRRRV